MVPQYFYISVANAAKDGSHAGEIAEGWFVVDDGEVKLTNAAGKFERGGAQRELPDGANPLPIAKDLLRARKPKRDFWRRLPTVERGIY
jgi:hypothetical protein